LDQTRFYPNCRDTISYFSGKSHAIFSNKPVYFIERILAELNFNQPFVTVLGGDSVERKKPDPQGLLHIMETLRIPPEETLMVGDSSIDMESGRKAGVFTCAVTYGLASRESLEQSKPDWIIHDFAEIKNLFC
jgi:phosphoglycolate phosphatase